MKVPKLTRPARKAIHREQHAKQSAAPVSSKPSSDRALTMPKVGASKRHKQELDDLETKDPEFFRFLQENDQNLLNFDAEEDDEGDDDDDDDDDDEGMEDDEEEEPEQVPVKGKGKALINLNPSEPVEVTTKILKNTVDLALTGSLRALHRLVSIFRAACIPTSREADDDEVGQPAGRFLVNDPIIYEQVLSAVFESASAALTTVLGEQLDSLEAMAEHPKWKKMKPIVQSFFRSVLFTLSGVASSSNPGEVAAYLIGSIEPFICFLAPLPRLTKALLKVLLTLWSQNTPVDDGSNTRIHAYLRIRQISLLLPGAATEECFRSIYLTYARSSKSFSTVTSASVLFMSKCIAELYITDPAMAYQQAFLYIRQLALLLRGAVQRKTADASKQILNWQYLNCIRLWTKVIAAMPSKAELGELAYPLAQIMLGVIAAAPSIVNVPLRLHLISCLHQLAASCQLFIPTASKILEILDIADLFAKPTPSTDAPPALAHIIRFLPEANTKANVRDLIVSEVVTLIQHDADIYRYHVGYPEYTFLTIKKLRGFIKKSKIGRWRDLCRSLVNQLEQQAAHVKKLRSKLGKSPMDIVDFEPLLPKGSDPSHVRLVKLMSGHAVNEVAEVTVTDAVHGNKKVEERITNKQSKSKSEVSVKSSDARVQADETTAVRVKKTKKLSSLLEEPDQVNELSWSDDED